MKETLLDPFGTPPDLMGTIPDLYVKFTVPVGDPN